MTDTSLPSHQSSAIPSSYVDSYTPPSSNNGAAALPQTPVTATQPVAQTAAPSPSSSSDPLAELEKALQEYEVRQKQLTQKTQQVVQQTQETVKATGADDPLAELERVLDEYESKYKQQPDILTPATAGGLATEDKSAVLSPQEYEAVLKNEPVATTAPKTAFAADSGQGIEEQNIFELLGVIDAQAAEKEAFLDELQTALWEDFLDKDLALLVDQGQLKEIQDLRGQTALPENERQEKLIQKVEVLVPDVEEIMLEKALELKEDMVKERLSGMKEYYATRPAELTKIQAAEKQILAGQWKAGAQLLNTLTA